MSGTYPVVMGERGRLVVPAELRERLALRSGTPLLVVETPRGLLLATREQIRDLVREDLTGADLVADLMAQRRRAAAQEDDA